MSKAQTENTPFQTFTTRGDASKVDERVQALRSGLNQSKLNAFLVPRTDVHRGEEVPERDARLSWLTGFTGSAGLAIVAEKSAILLVDGRYTIQAPAQTDTNVFEIGQTPAASASAWLKDKMPDNARIGFDAWLHTPSEIEDLRAKLGDSVTLVPIENLIDTIWLDRPAEPQSEMEFLGTNRAGQSAADKLVALQKTLVAAAADHLVLTLPDSICWLFNIRARDVASSPLVLAFAIVPATGKPKLFLSADKLTAGTEKALGGTVELFPKSDFSDALTQLGDDATVWIDPAKAPEKIADILRSSGTKVKRAEDPIAGPKSRKNETELSGMREAQLYDAIAMAKFLAWFDDRAPQGGLTEIDIVKKLEGFRREEPTIVDASFGTISGSGAHGAIVHYAVTEESNRALIPGELMLVDSGAQYLCGTTDITRTMSTGSVTAEQKDRFTRVLKGMIAVSRARFLGGASGADLDVLARQFLWQDGVNYAHGTGHGVGHYLNVHEGPVGISPLARTPLSAGNILSNEPGYYKEGEYGIRIENLIHVTENSAYPGYLEFETLTYTPIDKRLLDLDLLTRDETAWLNDYHAKTWALIGARVTGDVEVWLRRATQPI